MQIRTICLLSLRSPSTALRTSSVAEQSTVSIGDFLKILLDFQEYFSIILN